MKTLLLLVLLCGSKLILAQSTLINSAGNGGFETGTTFAANSWTEVQGANNKWYVGTAATGYSGARGAFIGTNSTTYSYSSILTSTNHFYTDVTVPANQLNLTLSFKLKVTGNSNGNLLVFLCPNTVTPVAGSITALTSYYWSSPTGYFGSAYSNYTTVTLSKLCTTAGTYRIIFTWRNSGSTTNNPPAAVDDISLIASQCVPYAGTGYVSVTSLPYSSTSRTTCGKVNDFTSSNTTTCGSSTFLNSEEEIFEFKPASTGIVTISISNASSSNCAIMLYKGCPSTTQTCNSSSCVIYNQNSSTSKTMCGTLTMDSIYYLIVDGSSGCFSYDISISAPSSSTSNDYPCGATALTLGSVVSDDNTCATGTSEPSTPTCWTAGTLNTLWYSFTAPSSGQVHFGYQNGSLTQPQIELFSGTCSSPVSVSGTCNAYSQVLCPGATFTGLTPNATYMIRLDGTSNAVGSFSFVVDDNSGQLTQVSADCGGAIEMCSTVYYAAANSMGCGSKNEVPTSGSISNPSTNPNCCNQGCLLDEELNSRWYRLNIATSGTLAWSLSGTVTGFFDWEMWNITNSSCSAISGNTLSPIRCNWNASSNGFTGMQSPVPTGGVSGNFEQPLSVTAGETYVLCVTNYSSQIAAYTLDFSNSTCTFGGSTSTWIGYSNTTWTSASNWSGCNGVPSCTVSGVVNSSGNQPVVSSSSSVKDMTVNSGSTLTISAGVTLTVCGNLTINGTLSASPTSTIILNGSGTQYLGGTLSGTNKIGNLTITKSSGTVILNSDVEIAGSLTTTNSTSILSANGKYIKLAGNFSNASGSITFTNVGTGTLEFNGTSAQTYSPGGTLTLYNVKMNQSPASSVTLSGGNLNLSGNLTLTSGRILTGTNEVSVTNTASACVPTGNANSYVDGSLRRSVTSFASYDFPVGQSSSGEGWQRANIAFSGATTATNLLAKFQSYASLPSAPGFIECGNNYNLPPLNNGYWTITATPTGATGSYNTTLYNTAGTYSNSSGAVAWTVIKNDGSGWALNGTCATSTINQVVRTGMSGFSDFGTGQATLFLPIQLSSFTGIVTPGGNSLSWETESELNNDFFTLERSPDISQFMSIEVIKGAGTSSSHHSYHSLDRHPYEGMNFYRLKQTDFNGKFTYSHIVALENHAPLTTVISISPNPSHDETEIELSAPEDADLTVEINDITGNPVNVMTEEIHPGLNKIIVSLSGNPPGVYMIELSSGKTGFHSVRKLVKY